jgi:hypothetical protein
MDRYKARQDVTEKKLLQVLEVAINLKPYNCGERWRKMMWKVLYLSNS